MTAEPAGSSNPADADSNLYRYGTLEFRIGLTVARENDVFEALRAGNNQLVQGAREDVARNRGLVYTYLGRSVSQVERDFLNQLLADARAYDVSFNDQVRAARDDAHASQMELLAGTSNEIAQKAEASAQALKRWTVVLALVTGVLALATVALVVATLRLD